MAPTHAPVSLDRSIRRWDLIGVVINGVIGAGIFGLPSKIFSLSGAHSILAFGVCAICVSLVVLSFAEVASRFSGTGGPYLYARETFGPTSGFTVGWLVWIARITSFAANCSLLPTYLDLFSPGAGSGLPRALIITGIVVTLAILNVTGVRLVANASNTFAVGKLLPLAVFIIVGLFFLDRSRFSFAVTPTYHSFSQSVLLLVYAFTGFEMAVIPGGEIRNPQRNLPAALLSGMAIVVVFYVLIQIVCIGTLPGLATSQRPLADAAGHFLGTGGAIMITAGMVVSLAGNLNVLILSASRIVFAMGESGDLPAILATIHPRFRTPLVSILLTTAVMLVLTLSGTFIYLITLSTVSRLVTYFATCVALPLLRRRVAAPRAAFLMPAGTIIASAGVVLIFWLLSNCTITEARDTAIALAAGLCLYAVNRGLRARRPRPT